MAYQSDGQRTYRKESDYDKRPVIKALADIEKEFDAVGSKHDLDHRSEWAFVWSIFSSNLSLLEKASKEPQLLKRALLTQAGIGLSLDPGRQFSYLTIRRGKLIYDVGYRGLIKLAVDEGLIRHAKPELVYERDTFVYHGSFQAPEHHSSNVFGNRGAIVGGYCVARLADGTDMVETMPESEFLEISKINKDSDAWKKDYSSGEMRKKTLIKRASKWWYNAAAETTASGRLEAAAQYLNEDAGEGFQRPSGGQPPSDDPADNSSAGQPPEPRTYVLEDVPEAQRHLVDKLLSRTREAHQYAAAREYAKNRMEGDALGYTLQAIDGMEAAESAAPPPADIPDPGDDAVADADPDTGEIPPPEVPAA